MSGSAFDIVLDELTLARARGGDLRACEAIYRLYQGPAYSIAFRICQCPSLAQDVLQEAFINAFKRLKQFRGDAPFWGWLRRVVVNHAISTLRKQPVRNPVELEDFHAFTDGDQLRVEMSADLAAAFGQLEAQDRSVVWLHDVEGYNHNEIAALFGMTESFSKTRLSRARARLRELLGQHMRPGQSSDEGSGDDVGGRSRAPLDSSRASCPSLSKCIPAQIRGTGASLHNGSLGADTDVSVAGSLSHIPVHSDLSASLHKKARSYSGTQLAADATESRSYSEFAPAFGES
jgi:RNA polymerase sigma factor (sigma-70 family)